MLLKGKKNQIQNAYERKKIKYKVKNMTGKDILYYKQFIIPDLGTKIL